MDIVIELTPFLKRLNEINNIFDLVGLSRDIAKESSLQVKKRILEIKCELHAESILGPKWQRRKPGSEHKLFCVKCGTVLSPDKIKRNGHYNKGINFDEGYTKLRMPLLVHKNRDCLGMVQVKWPFLEKRKRFWFDVIFNVIGYYFEGIGLRGIKRIIGVRQGTSCGIMSIWRMIQRVGETLRNCCPLPSAKNVKAIGLDELFMRLRIFRGKGKKALKKTVYGLLVKALGKSSPLLNFGISTKRDENRWQEEVDSLYERGINHENGLQIAIRDGSEAISNAIRTALPFVSVQECVFHIQKDLFKLLRDKYGRDSLRVKRIIKKVKAVFRAKTIKKAEVKLRSLSSISKFAYQYMQSKKGDMFTYLFHKQKKIDGKSASCNTNNGMERENRELKKRLKIMVSFKSIRGAENFAAIMLRREFYRLQEKCWLENLFTTIPVVPKPIKKPQRIRDRSPCLSSAEVNKLIGVSSRTNKNINNDLPIVRTSDFGITFKHWIDGYSILEN